MKKKAGKGKEKNRWVVEEKQCNNLFSHYNSVKMKCKNHTWVLYKTKDYDYFLNQICKAKEKKGMVRTTKPTYRRPKRLTMEVYVNH